MLLQDRQTKRDDRSSQDVIIGDQRKAHNTRGVKLEAAGRTIMRCYLLLAGHGCCMAWLGHPFFEVY